MCIHSKSNANGIFKVNSGIDTSINEIVEGLARVTNRKFSRSIKVRVDILCGS